MSEAAPSYLEHGRRSTVLAVRVVVLLASVVGVPVVALWGGATWSRGRAAAETALRWPVSEHQASKSPPHMVASQPSVDERIVQMLHRLQRAGALYYRLDREPGPSDASAFVFQCRMDGAEDTFSAAEPDAISAIGRVLGQVESWLASDRRSLGHRETTARNTDRRMDQPR